MFPEESLEEQANIPEDSKNVKSIVYHSTVRTLKQYKPDPYGRIKVRTTDQLFRQAKENSWYKWVEFTGKQIEAENCYLCSRNRRKALYVINTQFNWGLCGEEGQQRFSEQENSMTEQIEDKHVVCSMHCLLYLRSSVFNTYYEKSRDGDPLNKIMKNCREMDKTIRNNRRSDVAKRNRFQYRGGIRMLPKR